MGQFDSTPSDEKETLRSCLDEHSTIGCDGVNVAGRLTLGENKPAKTIWCHGN